MLKETYIAKVLDAAIRNEERGEQFYEELSQKFGDHEVLGNLFQTLAGDEEDHKRRFIWLRNRYVGENAELVKDDGKPFVGPKEIESFFEANPTEPDATKGTLVTQFIDTKEEALTRALEFEKSSLAYYEGMAKLLGESKELRAMINEEKSHVREVTKSALSIGSKYRGMG